MGFEKFEKDKGGKGGAGPRISLRKSGSMGINGKAIEELFSDEKYVTLYYDKENNMVGIKPERRDSKDAYTLQRRNQSGHGGSISATAFMREYDLIPNKTKQYKARWDESQGMIVADVSDPVITYDS
ncbi:hypothetical protein EXE43_16015 [Halorubrum sp. SS5]|nr:hypothetical protein EXE43_16015 [Halorubrum sp. SS5]